MIKRITFAPMLIVTLMTTAAHAQAIDERVPPRVPPGVLLRPPAPVPAPKDARVCTEAELLEKWAREAAPQPEQLPLKPDLRSWGHRRESCD